MKLVLAALIILQLTRCSFEFNTQQQQQQYDVQFVEEDILHVKENTSLAHDESDWITSRNDSMDHVDPDGDSVNGGSRGYRWLFLSLSLFSVFGILGNFLVCITIKRDHTLQTKTNYYLFSLAITDLAVCVIVIPLAIIQDFTNKWIFDSHVCTLWVFFDLLLCTSSIYHLCAVSILRFIAIQFPLKSNRNSSSQPTFFIVFSIWTVSILFSSIILYLGLTDHANIIDHKSLRCTLRNLNMVIYGSIFSFVIPLLIMILMFSLMARKLRMQIYKLESASGTSTPRRYCEQSDGGGGGGAPNVRSSFKKLSLYSQRGSSTAALTSNGMRRITLTRFSENSTSLNGIGSMSESRSLKKKKEFKLIFGTRGGKKSTNSNVCKDDMSITSGIGVMSSNQTSENLRSQLNPIDGGGAGYESIQPLMSDSINTAACSNTNLSNRPKENNHQLRRHLARSTMQKPSFSSSISSMGSTNQYRQFIFRNMRLNRSGKNRPSTSNYSFDSYTKSLTPLPSSTTVDSHHHHQQRPGVKMSKSFRENELILNTSGRSSVGYHSSITSSMHRNHHQSIQVSNNEMHNELKALQVLGIVFIAFIVAWLPFCFVNMLCAVLEMYEKFSLLAHLQNYMIYLSYLGYMQSTFNPIIYTIFNKKFRRNFIDILTCSKKKNRSRFKRDARVFR